MDNRERAMNGIDRQCDSSNHFRNAGSEARAGAYTEQRSVIIGRNQQRNVPRSISYDVLKTWVDMEDAGRLVLLMSSERQQLEKLLNQPKISEQMLDLLLDALNHAITAQHHKTSIQQLLDTLCSSKFLEHMTDYLKDKEITKVTWNDAKIFFTAYLHILEEIMDKLPQFAIICLSKASELLKSASVFDSIKKNASFLNEIAKFSEKVKEIVIAQKEQERRSRGEYLQSNDSERPPDNFVKMSVEPTSADLQEGAKPFIRSAQTEGKYDDIDHYLDVQFRLMREDFIIPLREAIVKFKHSDGKTHFSSSEATFYYDVKIIGIVISSRIDHCLQFDVSAMKCSQQHILNCLKFGSLLCLSKDNFASVLLATVEHCDEDSLAKGIVTVSFRTDLDVVFSSTTNDVYVMVQTSAYFESYCHVLEGLKEMTTKLPLQDYIIHCKTELRPPRYLLPTGGVRRLPVYDLSCLMERELSCKVPVLTTIKWPKADVMCLNESQRAAAQLALTKELAVIQGPPGTGKTYVGLKVMQVLLENKHIITGSADNSSDPILVVCYTNHALDQFLEGVLKFCPDGIVRVGGQSKSEQLSKLNLTNLKQKQSVVNSAVKQSIKECSAEMETISTEIYKLNQIMESLQTDIINEQVLEGFIEESHYISLVSKGEQSNNTGKINAWLRTDNNTARSVVPQMIKHHLNTLVLDLETESSNTNLSTRMNIIERASVYNFYLNKYKSNLNKEMDLLSTQKQSHETASRIKEIENCLKDTRSKILTDEEMGQVLPPALFNKMTKYLTSDSRPFVVPEDGVVESWLLGLNKDLQSQLDDVEFIMNHNNEEMANDIYYDDAYKKEQNDRMVDDDATYLDKDNVGLRSALNSMTLVIQRAHSLGISDDMFMEEEEEPEAWTTRVKSLNLRKVMDKLRFIEPMTEENEKNITSVWDLRLDERFALYHLWIKKYKATLTSKMKNLASNYKLLQEKKKEANSEETLCVLRKAKVIGMTTTGAARHRSVLQTLGCRIIVVEEAAEVLESHIVTSLNENCKHLILIGDHQQLRPKTTVYQLAKDFGLEISLFERLIKNKVPHVMLKEQHRMRPEISEIMRHIYPDLQDHSSVANYEKIRGVSKNIFFIQHEHKETHLNDSMSKANAHEAKFLVALCQYLLNQGYEASQITILATYAGQVIEIWKRLDKELNVHLTTVDNFQGEENDIILLSLVRSNTENQTGFLKVDNRVCVALSRAKKGLYVIGNFNLLASQSKLWNKIVNTAKGKQIIDIGIPVICEKHPGLQELVISDEDFKKHPGGGCGRPCNFVLKCGHTCGLPCHGYDAEHVNYKCQKFCSRKCEVGHPCRKPCFQNCGKCSVLVIKTIPICGHEDQVPCSVPPAEAICTQRCEYILDCQHRCSGRCGQCRRQNEHNTCAAQVLYQWGCGHTGGVPCHLVPPKYPCNQPCGAKLQCGHTCKGNCVECLAGAVHVACEEYCEKQLPCGHPCHDYCGILCSPCKKICPFECRHGACHKQKPPPLCSHACEPCMEECKYRCRHKQCSQTCSQDCDFKCKYPCYFNLKKNNQHAHDEKCSGYCGELCVCRQCIEVSEILSLTEKAEVQKSNCAGGTKQHSAGGGPSGAGAAIKEETASTNTKSKEGTNRRLLTIPSCRHTFVVTELDNYVYKLGSYGTSYIPCPRCERPILKCKRYETINKARRYNREIEKINLNTQNIFSAKLKEDLQKSQKRLENSSMLTEFLSLNVEEVDSVQQVQALSFKFKCAFLLNTIFSIRGNNHTPSDLELLKSRTKAVLQIPSRLADQQRQEFVTEMSRCLWLLYLSYLVRESTAFGIDDEARMIIPELHKPKPAHILLERAERVSIEISSRIQRMLKETAREDLNSLEQSVISAVNILRSGDDQMLCHLLVGDAKKDKPEPKSQTTAVKPDKQETNEWSIAGRHKKKSATARKYNQQQQKSTVNGNQQPARGNNPISSQASRSTSGAGASTGNKEQQKSSTNERQQPARGNNPKSPQANSSTSKAGASTGNREQQKSSTNERQQPARDNNPLSSQANSSTSGAGAATGDRDRQTSPDDERQQSAGSTKPSSPLPGAGAKKGNKKGQKHGTKSKKRK